jgi:hypothetical protein
MRSEHLLPRRGDPPPATLRELLGFLGVLVVIVIVVGVGVWLMRTPIKQHDGSDVFKHYREITGQTDR